MDIRKLTCVIIQKDGQYLVGMIMWSKQIRWSGAAYDAWRTRDPEQARRIARRVGGTTMLFNPAAGQLRAMK